MKSLGVVNVSFSGLLSSRSLMRKKQSLLCESWLQIEIAGAWHNGCWHRYILEPVPCFLQQAVKLRARYIKSLLLKGGCKPPQTESGATLLKILAVLSGSNPNSKPLTSTKNKNCVFYIWKDTFICQKGAERIERIEEEKIFIAFKETGEHWSFGSILDLQKHV